MGNKTTSVGGDNSLIATEDPAKLRAQIAETRNEMSDTIEELHGRLNPVVLKEQALDQFHDATETVKAELKAHFVEAKEVMKQHLLEAKTAIKSEISEELDAVKTKFSEEMSNAKAAVREATIGKVEHMVQGAQDTARNAGRSLVDTVRENPIPAALATVGLAWLFLNRRRQRSAPRTERGMRDGSRVTRTRVRGGSPNGLSNGIDRSGQRYGLSNGRDNGSDSGPGRRVQELASQAGRKIADTAQGAASAVSEFAHDAGGKASELAHDAQDRAIDIVHGAGDQARRVGRRSSEIYRANPLAVGAAMLAVGTVIGLAVPSTRLEDEWLGSASDNVMDKAHELAHQAIGKAGDAVQHMADEVSSRSDNDGSDMGKTPPRVPPAGQA